MMELFNTLSRKREKNFLSVCETLAKEGVETVEQAEKCRATMLSNAKVYVSFVLLVGVSLAIIFNSVALPILVGTGIIVLYIVTSVVRGRGLVKRFIDDILLSPEVQEKRAEDKKLADKKTQDSDTGDNNET